jgi:hypothetical protein
MRVPSTMSSLLPPPSAYPVLSALPTACRCSSLLNILGSLPSSKPTVHEAYRPLFFIPPLLLTTAPAGAVHIYHSATNRVVTCTPPSLPPSPQPATNWMGSLFAVLPFNRQAAAAAPLPAALSVKVLDAVSTKPNLHHSLIACFKTHCICNSKGKVFIIRYYPSIKHSISLHFSPSCHAPLFLGEVALCG